jgi:hypothetical protein
VDDSKHLMQRFASHANDQWKHKTVEYPPKNILCGILRRYRTRTPGDTERRDFQKLKVFLIQS